MTSDSLAPTKPDQDGPANPNLLIAIGGSAGSFRPIVSIVEQLPPTFQGTLLVATHRSPSQVNALADILDHRSRMDVIEPADEECLGCTKIYVGNPGDRVRVSGKEFDIEKDHGAWARMRRIDDLFFSVARSAGENAVGIILSGALDDGVRGLSAIHDVGGTCIVQTPTQAENESMPVKALEAVPIARVATTQEIASLIMELAAGRRCHPG